MTYTGSTPSKLSDGSYHYTFDKWVTEQGGTTAANLDEVTGDMTVYASFTSEAHSYAETVVAPTTEAQGYTEHECTVCGDSYRDNYVDKLKAQTIEVAAESFEKNVGETFALEVKAKAGDADGGALAYASSDEKVATVAADGTVTAVGVGEAKITVSVAAVSGYGATTKDVTVKVARKAQAITVKDAEVAYGATAKLDAATDGDGKLSYASSDEKVATVAADGTVTPVGLGTATITVSAAQTDACEAATAQATITVVKGAQAVKLAENSFSKTVGDAAFKLDAAAEGAITYKSSDDKVATVGADGTVTVVGAGSATITVTAAATDLYDEGSAEAKVAVSRKAQTVTAKDATATYGDAAFKLEAVTDGDGALSFESSDEKVATVAADGTVTVVGAGEATITVSAAQTDTYAAASAKAKVSVARKAQTVTAKDVVKTFGAATFDLGAKVDGEGALSYATSNAKVATVSNGKVALKGAGTAKITVSAAETANYLAASKTVTVKVNKAANTLKLNKATRTVKLVKGKKATAKAKTVAGAAAKNAKGKVTYAITKASKSKAKFSINKANGKITVKKGAKKGTYKLTVKASAAGNANYKAGSKTAVVTVKVK